MFIHGLKQVMTLIQVLLKIYSDLSPGIYQVNVTDANGCSSDQTFTISEPDELLISSSVLSAIGCYDGNANIKVDVNQASVGPYVFTLVWK